MADLAATSGGQAAPAGNSKQQPGAVAPAGNGTPTGSPSTPSSEAALVAEKKKAEHWQKKYERDVGELRSETKDLRTKLDGLTTGFEAARGPAPKPAAKTFADLDDSGLRDVLKRGMDDQNPDFIYAVSEQIGERKAKTLVAEAEARAKSFVEREFAKRSVGARVVQDFGADAVNNESELNQLAMQYRDELLQADPQLMERNPSALYHCFKLARDDLRQGDFAELDRLRKSEAERLAVAEIEQNSRVIGKARGDKVDELLKQGDRRGAILEAFPLLRKPPRRAN